MSSFPTQAQSTAAFHFALSFGDAPGETVGSFSEVSGIGAEMVTERVAEGGENRYFQALPKATRNRSLVLKRGVLPLASPLVSWCRDLLEGGLTQPVTARDLRVSLLDEAGRPLRSWSFDAAYPVKWEIDAFVSDKTHVVVEKIELAYGAMKRVV